MGKRHCYEAYFQRNWTYPDETGLEFEQPLGKKRFQSLRAVARAAEVSSLGDWRWTSNSIWGTVEQTEWEPNCDDEHRACRDWFKVERCGGVPLSWPEHVRLGRLLGMRNAWRKPRSGVRVMYEEQWLQWAARTKLERQTRDL